MNATKWIVTSKVNLKNKYKGELGTIQQLLKNLVTADKARKIDTRILYIDDATSAKAADIPAVSGTTPRDCKTAIDNLYKKHLPDYIVILGAQDIIPFQQITNPATDDDREVPSDLPYACDAAYSKNIASFTGPTRVVGRIPDVPGQGDPKYLEAVISNIIDYKPAAAGAYKNYFAVSAEVWKKSTQQSVLNIFGQNKSLLLSPPAAPAAGYTTAQLSLQAHFINCHGALGDTRFYGQRGGQYPVALNATNLVSNVAKNTVVAAECCYGAELIDPADSADGKTMSIASTYLAYNALAFVGSSTIAYGPADGQGLADLITQYFLINALNAGTSAGRAFLEARQKYISTSGPQLDPVELKTIAQFYLLGDPSIVLIEVDPAVNLSKGIGNTLRNRRKNLVITGLNLADTIASAQKVAAPAPAKSVAAKGARAKSFDFVATEAEVEGPPVKTNTQKEKEINAMLKEHGFEDALETIYTVETPMVAAAKGYQKKMIGGRTGFRTFMKRDKVHLEEPAADNAKGSTTTINKDSILVIKEDETAVLRWRVYVAR